MREAEEETGLTQLGAPRFLGDGAEDPPRGYACIYETTTVYPVPISSDQTALLRIFYLAHLF